jgi:hemerythrin-like domain-containing protein
LVVAAFSRGLRNSIKERQMRVEQRRVLLQAVAGAVGSTAMLKAAVSAVVPARPELPPVIEPTEELMHQHGVLRRIARLFGLAADRLAAGDSLPRSSVLGAAALFREFGTNHHERKLEEGYVFPDLQRLDSRWESVTQVLIDQHRRGEEILDFVMSVVDRQPLSREDVDALAQSLRGFKQMHEYHTAVEESALFPTWKSIAGQQHYLQVQQAFSTIARDNYGREGIAGAAKQIASLEQAMGAPELADMTAARPRGAH